MDYGLLIVVLALVVVILLPIFAERLGVSDTLEDMAQKGALRYGLDLDAIRRHDFQARVWTTSLFKHAECPICLQTGQMSWSLLLKPGGQKCGHFFCSSCARRLLETSGNCAICRSKITGLVSIPDPQDDPEGWFKAVDAKNDRRLDREEILNILRVLCAEDHSSGVLQTKIEELWPIWDQDKDGYISLGGLFDTQILSITLCSKLSEEMMDSEYGLLVFIVNTAAFAAKATIPEPQHQPVISETSSEATQ